MFVCVSKDFLKNAAKSPCGKITSLKYIHVNINLGGTDKIQKYRTNI
jgi:hypothetical protein